ncbi:unnamed protein product [Ectocarpus fasciculatus]
MRCRLVNIRRSFSSRPGPTPKLIVEADCSWTKVVAQVASHGRTCLAVADENAPGQAAGRCLFELQKAGINCAMFTGRGAYPTTDGIDEAREMARRIGATCIVSVGSGGTIDTAKAAARLHASSGGCKHFLTSPGGVLMGEGGNSKPRRPAGNALPLVAIPTSAGAGAAANGRCLVWHPDDEVLVPLAGAAEEGESLAVALVDPMLCTSLSKAQTVAMAMTALSACVDALLARELALASGVPLQNGDALLDLGRRGIGALAEGLPVALADGKNKLARELLTIGSVCAGQLAVATPAPPAQLVARATGSLLGRHSYPSVCAMVFPHVVGDMLGQANSFSGDAQAAEAIERALSLSASLFLGDGNDGPALLSWLEAQGREWLDFASLSSVDSTISAKDVATNIDMLLAIEEDTDAADRVWSAGGTADMAELIVG